MALISLLLEQIDAKGIQAQHARPSLAREYAVQRAIDGHFLGLAIDHVWPAPPLATIPAGLASLDDFSARWEGTIEAPEDGEYEIGIEGDDGYRMFLDGQLAAESWENGGKRLATKRITLARGQKLPVKIEYFQAHSGSILPMGPVMQYATEQPDAPLEIRIYPGADGRFTLYADDNETYAYERGQSARTTLTWNDREGTLSIGARHGSFPGMSRVQTFNLVLVDQANGAGIASAKPARTVRYDGRAMRVNLKQ